MRQASLAACLMLMTGAATAQDGGPTIDEITWHNIESYCSFMRADHAFAYEDPGSWRWVLFSNFPTDGADPLEMPFMRIDGQLMQLRQTGVEAAKGGEVHSYTSQDADPYRVTVSLLEGEKGYESSGFSGVITVSRHGASSETAYKGDCGV